MSRQSSNDIIKKNAEIRQRERDAEAAGAATIQTNSQNEEAARVIGGSQVTGGSNDRVGIHPPTEGGGGTFSGGGASGSWEGNPIFGRGDPTKILSGTAAEREGQLAGLNIGALGYGQGLGETGDDIQRIKGLQRDRTNQSGGDPVSAAIMNQKAGNVANAQREMAKSGVKGGVAANATAAVARASDADIAASLYGQQSQSIAAERSLASNMLAGTTSLMHGEKAANVQAPEMPKDSGSSFICTRLKSKGLMTSKESMIMSKFMIQSIFTRADFLVWYFRHGKAATERAEAEGFDWSSIKTLFVDDIIALIKEGKMVEAQNLYAARTGNFCQLFGAKPMSPWVATKRFIAFAYVPRLFLIDNCRTWLKANYLNIPKILKATV